MIYLGNKEKSLASVSTKIVPGNGLGSVYYTAQEAGLYLVGKYWVDSVLL